MPNWRPHSSRAGLMSTPMIMSAPASLRALDHVEADPAEAEHHDVVADLDLGGVDHRADPGGDPAADVAAGLERRVLADLRHRDLGQHGEVREGRAAHVVEDRLALVARSGWSRRASAPCPGWRGSRCTGWSCRERHDLHWRHSGVYSGITWSPGFTRVTPGPTSRTIPAPSWPRIEREDAFGVEPVERVGVGVADAGRHDLDQHLAGLAAPRDRARRSRAAAWPRRRRRRGSSFTLLPSVSRWLTPAARSSGLAVGVAHRQHPDQHRAEDRADRT